MDRGRDSRSYTSKHLIEKLLVARSALEGERKQVTVLFADVRVSLLRVARPFPITCGRRHSGVGAVLAQSRQFGPLGDATPVGR